MKVEPVSQDTINIEQESTSAQHGINLTQDKQGRNLNEVAIRADINTLTFKDQEQELDFKNVLYCSSANERKPSREFFYV